MATSPSNWTLIRVTFSGHVKAETFTDYRPTEVADPDGWNTIIFSDTLVIEQWHGPYDPDYNQFWILVKGGV